MIVEVLEAKYDCTQNYCLLICIADYTDARFTHEYKTYEYNKTNVGDIVIVFWVHNGNIYYRDKNYIELMISYDDVDKYFRLLTKDELNIKDILE